MIYYETDFLLNSPNIQPKSVNLFLSSVPLQILDEECGLLFGIINRFMQPDGWILIDAPAGFNDRFFNIVHAAQASGWNKYCHHICTNHYHEGEDQIVFVLNKPSERGYVRGDNQIFKVNRKRPKKHPCEFCPELISSLIEKYSDSERGDVVLDPFCGTGTVPGEADRLGRFGIGCDVRPRENIREEYR